MFTFHLYVSLPSFPSLSIFFCFLVSLSCTIHCSFCYTISSSPVYLLSLLSSLSFSQSFFPFVLNLFFSLSSFFSACLTLLHQSPHISALLSLKLSPVTLIFLLDLCSIPITFLQTVLWRKYCYVLTIIQFLTKWIKLLKDTFDFNTSLSNYIRVELTFNSLLLAMFWFHVTRGF